jgi:hypothetical protein
VWGADQSHKTWRATKHLPHGVLTDVSLHSPLLRLPNETIDMVLDFLPRDALIALSQTTRYCHTMTQPSIYRDLTLVSHNNVMANKYAAFLRGMRTRCVWGTEVALLSCLRRLEIVMSPYRCQSKARVFVHFHRTLPNVISNAPHLEAFSYEGAARASEFDPTFGYAFWAAITNIKHLRLSRVHGYICSPPGCDNTSNTFAFETLVLEHVGFRRCVNYLLEASRLTLKRIKLINIRRYENNPLESPPHYGHDNMVFPLLEELICEKVYQDCFLTRGAASGKWISPNLKSIGFLPNYCDHDVPFTSWIYAPNPAKIKCLGFHINDACITHQSLCSLFENLSGTLTQLVRRFDFGHITSLPTLHSRNRRT